MDFLKHNAYFMTLFLALTLAACGTDRHHFKIEGRFLHLNQGEFYVYSPSGDLDGLDTLRVEAGRFALEIPCETPTVLMIIFPNFTEQPIFAEPGATVDIKGDASHLKEMEVTGTDDNELMTKFRQQIVNASPPECKKYAVQFIKDHPESAVGVYLLNRYLLKDAKPDYAQIVSLADLMIAKQPKNGYLIQLKEKTQRIQRSAISGSLPQFSVKDINGNALTQSYLTSAPVAVAYSWATWSYDSRNFTMQLRDWEQQSSGRLKVLGVCLDGNVEECRQTVKGDGITWPTVCDGKMMDGMLVQRLGLWIVPDNVVLVNGRIVGHSMTTDDLRRTLQPYL